MQTLSPAEQGNGGQGQGGEKVGAVTVLQAVLSPCDPGVQ